MAHNNLYSGDALKKLKELAEGIDYAMMATALSNRPIHMVPMSTKRVDDSGRIWFLSGKDSQHNQNLKEDNDVHLIYAATGAMQFLNVYGTAEVSTDKSVLKSLYVGSDDAWFEGVDDPNLSAIGITPTHASYWDPKDNKLITLIKMGIGAVTGKQPDLLNQGKLKV